MRSNLGTVRPRATASITSEERTTHRFQLNSAAHVIHNLSIKHIYFQHPIPFLSTAAATFSVSLHKINCNLFRTAQFEGENSIFLVHRARVPLCEFPSSENQRDARAKQTIRQGTVAFVFPERAHRRNKI